MKSINYFIAAATILLSTTSCVESSKKYKTLLAERDSLQVVEQQYNSTMDILNDVETGFTAIRERENNITLQINDSEGQPKTRKQIIRSQMEQINEILENNKAKIAELEERLKKEGKTNNSLNATIRRLQNELADRSVLVESLQQQLAQKDIELDRLAEVVTNLKSDITVRDSITLSQEKEIAGLDKEIHTRWYCVGDKSELKEKQIIEGKGFLGMKTKVNPDFNNSVFTEIDMREFTSVNTESSSPKLMSNHPEGSYELVKNENKSVTLKITDSEKFWNNTKYLVIVR